MPDEHATGLVYSDRYLQHNTNPYRISPSGRPLPFVEQVDHPSNPRLVVRTKKLLDLTGLGRQMIRIEPRFATIEEIERYHVPDYVGRVEEICAAGGGDTGQGAPAGPDSYEIALLSAGGVMRAIESVMENRVRQCYALVRPPGHHAVADKGMGFCIFSNVAVAVMAARAAYNLRRVIIVDWDVHHGNGTQDAFYDDSGVLFVSLHQEGLYPPDSGTLDQQGSGDGEGYTVNIPLPAGSGDAAYLAAFERIVEPLATRFKPELVVVSAGQDASAMDPLGRMCVSAEGFRRMTAVMQRVAGEHAGGRLVLAQEGGYSEIYAPYCTLAIFEALTGERTGIEEPMSPERIARWPSSQTVSADQEQAIARVIAAQRDHWDLI